MTIKEAPDRGTPHARFTAGADDPCMAEAMGWRTARRILASSVAVIAAATVALSGCTSLEQYSVRAAEGSCDALSVCTVYGPNGQYLSPCTSAGRQTIYPGDPRWPYTTPGVCDAVRDGRVVSTRED